MKNLNHIDGLNLQMTERFPRFVTLDGSAATHKADDPFVGRCGDCGELYEYCCCQNDVRDSFDDF